MPHIDMEPGTLIPIGYDREVRIRLSTYRMLHYPEGIYGQQPGWAFAHDCWTGQPGDPDRKRITIAVRLSQDHKVLELDPLTIHPSLHCPSCGTHGFIHDGEWVPA